VEAGLLSEGDAAGHEDRGVVLNVLGFQEMFVHIGPPVRLRAMDTVLLASDGLTDNLSVARIGGLCRVGGAVKAVGALADEASRAMVTPPDGHPDDLTIVLYRPSRRRGE